MTKAWYNTFKQKYMKKLSATYKIITLAIFAFLLSVEKTFALDTQTTKEWIDSSSSKIATDTSIVATLFYVLDWILGLTGTVAVGFIIVGGFRYITSAGNESQAEAAKETITKAVMGLVFVLLAFVIASTIDGLLRGCVSGVPFGGATGPCR